MILSIPFPTSDEKQAHGLAGNSQQNWNSSRDKGSGVRVSVPLTHLFFLQISIEPLGTCQAHPR